MIRSPTCFPIQQPTALVNSSPNHQKYLPQQFGIIKVSRGGKNSSEAPFQFSLCLIITLFAIFTNSLRDFFWITCLESSDITIIATQIVSYFFYSSLSLFFELKIGTGLQQKKYNADEQNKINKARTKGWLSKQQTAKIPLFN